MPIERNLSSGPIQYWKGRRIHMLVMPPGQTKGAKAERSWWNFMRGNKCLYLVSFFPTRQRLCMAKANIYVNALEATSKRSRQLKQNRTTRLRERNKQMPEGRSRRRRRARSAAVRSLDGRRTDMRDKTAGDKKSRSHQGVTGRSRHNVYT